MSQQWNRSVPVILYLSQEFGMNKIPYKMAADRGCPCIHACNENVRGRRNPPLELLARRKSETSPSFSPPSSQGINVSFVCAVFFPFPSSLLSPQLPLGTREPISCQFFSFLSLAEDRWQRRSRLWNRPISVIYLQKERLKRWIRWIEGILEF